MMQGNLARRLRVLRAERGLSLTEAAERIGVTRDTISEIERGKRHPYMPTLAKIAQGYDVPVEELLEEEPAPLPPARQEVGQPKEEETTAQTAVPPSEEDETVIHLESADDIGAQINEILWNLPESRGRRLVVDIREDNSAEVRLMPAGSRTGRWRAKSEGGVAGRWLAKKKERRPNHETRES